MGADPAEQEVFRPVCLRCMRPTRVCYCAHLPSIPTQTRVLLLQHPRERDMAIGTARMASLCLPNSELHVGRSFDDHAAVLRALSDPARPAVLLYPGESATDVLSEPPKGPVTLVVVDGTWWQAKSIVRDNQVLRSLPRYAFEAPTPSEYRIRKEPKDEYVSTIEALVHVLGAVEGDPARFESMLTPFRAMIDAQLACKTERHQPRHKKKPPRPPASRLPKELLTRHADLVSVMAEANAWPYDDLAARASFNEELVHWVAYRHGTGETFDLTARPTHPLADGTTMHVRMTDADIMTDGVSQDELRERFDAFLRPTDLLCSWGWYGTNLMRRCPLRGQRHTHEHCDHRPQLDARHIARLFSRGKVGSQEEYLAELGEPPAKPLARGRAGLRLGELVATVEHFVRVLRKERDAGG